MSTFIRATAVFEWPGQTVEYPCLWHEDGSVEGVDESDNLVEDVFFSEKYQELWSLDSPEMYLAANGERAASLHFEEMAAELYTPKASFEKFAVLHPDLTEAKQPVAVATQGLPAAPSSTEIHGTTQPSQSDDPKYLLSDDGLPWQDYLDEVKSHLLSEAFDQETKTLLPRFDYASIFARSIPFVAYDDGAVKDAIDAEGIAGTAFTDGINCFFHVDFLRLIREADETEGKQGIIFLALHEIWHNMLLHLDRLQEFPHSIANAAEDMYINTNLQLRYKNAEPSTPLTIGWGFKPGDIEKYADRSENDIAAEMMKNPPPPPPMNGGKGSGGGFGDSHIIPPQTLADIFEKLGHRNVVDALSIPDDLEKERIRGKEIQQELVKTIRETNEIYNERGAALPGGHMGQYMMEVLNHLNKPKVTWQATFKRVLIGGGMGRGYTDDHPSDAYFYDPAMMGLNDRVYMGTMVPAKAKGCIVVGIDSSASMGNDNLSQAVSEALGLIKALKGNSAVPEVLMYWMDTVVRGEPILLDERNYQQVLRDFEQGRRGAAGRGGTNLENDIIEIFESDAINMAKRKHGHIKSFICMTDLGDKGPKKENLPKDIPNSFWYFAVSGTYNDSFAQQVSSYAKVVNMAQQNLRVNLDDNTQKQAGKKVSL